MRSLVALALALTAAAIVAHYPLAPGVFAALLVLYAVTLWRFPTAWLVVVPAALPAVDLAPWTGWSAVEEPDLVVLVTLAMLSLRMPPRRGDFVLSGASGIAVALAIAACIVGVVRGLGAPALPGGSSVAYLRPDNALRVAKGLAAALALLPFLRRATAERAPVSLLLAIGMAAGLALVAAAAMLERALFTGLFDFDEPYRIVATFSSMQFGGGYVGAYVAMALPFVLSLVRRRSGRWALLAAAVALGGLYTLVVTFARAAAGSGLVGCTVYAAARLWGALRRPTPLSSLGVPVVLLLVVVGAVAAAMQDSNFMEYRMSRLAPDLAWRERLWTEGMEERRPGIVTALFGMGLGTYARTLAASLPMRERPGNVVVETGPGGNDVALSAGQLLYVGQRVQVEPDTAYRLSFGARAVRPGTVVEAALCENAMLYSTNCRIVRAEPEPDGAWHAFDFLLESKRIGRYAVLHVLHRPAELTFFLPVAGTAADVGNIALSGASGRALLVNGDFSAGLAHWFLTDDAHTEWRIENQYLMTFFEEGALGLAAFLLLAGTGIVSAGRAAVRGEPMAAALLASLAAFLASGMFDCPLDVPRLAALFYLVAFAAITMGET